MCEWRRSRGERAPASETERSRSEFPRSGMQSGDLVALQELAGDHDLLDLAGPLADQQERGVAVQALDGVLGRVAVPAVHAQGVGDDLVAGLGAEVLGHPGLQVRPLAGGLLL